MEKSSRQALQSPSGEWHPRNLRTSCSLQHFGVQLYIQREKCHILLILLRTEMNMQDKDNKSEHRQVLRILKKQKYIIYTL